jgi:hypothetical protein
MSAETKAPTPRQVREALRSIRPIRSTYRARLDEDGGALGTMVASVDDAEETLNRIERLRGESTERTRVIRTTLRMVRGLPTARALGVSAKVCLVFGCDALQSVSTLLAHEIELVERAHARRSR